MALPGANTIIARLHSSEAREAMTAFFERRQPDFSRVVDAVL